MAKFTLSIEDDYDFFLCAICSHERDYRLSWYLNEALEISLVKEENLDMERKKERYGFSFYSYEDETHRLDYFLIGNKCLSARLIPEEKQADFFLKVTGPLDDTERELMVEKIDKLPIVLKAYHLEVEQLKSRKNLIF